MLWGVGDSAKLNDDERRTLDHLRRMVETGHIVSLTPAESRLAQNALSWYAKFIAFGQILQSVRNVGLLIGVLLGLWWASEGALAEWVRNVNQR